MIVGMAPHSAKVSKFWGLTQPSAWGGARALEGRSRVLGTALAFRVGRCLLDPVPDVNGRPATSPVGLCWGCALGTWAHVDVLPSRRSISLLPTHLPGRPSATPLEGTAWPRSATRAELVLVPPAVNADPWAAPRPAVDCVSRSNTKARSTSPRAGASTASALGLAIVVSDA